MIDAVSKVSFRGDAGADLINAPGKFSVQAPVADNPADSFEKSGEKKSHKGLKVLLGTALVALAAFAGLGYAVKNGNLSKVEIKEGEGFFKTLWPKAKNLGVTIGEKAQSCYETVAGWFGKKAAEAGEKAAEAGEKAAEAGEKAAEAATK